jgi:hypothetical protein
MFARPCSLKQFMAECGVQDVFLDAVQLGSPSGHISQRSEKLLKGRIAQRQSAWFRAYEAYLYFLDADVLWDPTGEFQTGRQRYFTQQVARAEALLSRARLLIKMASLHPRSYPREARKLRDQAVMILSQLGLTPPPEDTDA